MTQVGIGRNCAETAVALNRKVYGKVPEVALKSRPASGFSVRGRDFIVFCDQASVVRA